MKEKRKIKKRKKQPKKNVKRKWMQNQKFCRKGNLNTNYMHDYQQDEIQKGREREKMSKSKQ